MSRIAVVALTLFSLAAAAQELPVGSFGQLPLVERPTISPDGKYVALIVNGEEGPTVNVAEFGSREMTPVAMLKYGVDRIEYIHWANNERLLIASSESTLYVGDRYRVGRLYSVDRDGKNLKRIGRKTVKEPSPWTFKLDTTNVIDWLKDDPKHVLMQLYDELDEAWSVFEVDIYKNKFRKLFVNSYDVSNWYTDHKGNVVFGSGYEDGVITTWYRKSSDAEWEKLYSRKVFETSFAPIIVDGDKAIVMSDHELYREALWRYDIPSGEFEELLFSVEGYDLDDVIFNADESEMVGASYLADYRRHKYFDEAYTATADLVAKSFAQYETVIVSRSEDKNRLIILAIRDNSPPKYFWLDLAQGAGSFWFSQFPYLEQATLAEVAPYDFEARDGTELSGYLTMPVANEGEKPPLVVFPHGGPRARDYRYFNPYVQFFANRGYAVLQVNFRGSKGFNNDLEVAGYREWGMAMQEDVYDAIDWAEQQGAVDTERMCMVGASYGGYVALVAAFQRPEQFRCIASLAGISDLREMVAMDSKFNQDKSIIGRMIGDPTDGDDKVMMDRNSAVNNIARIKRPILLIHGTHDTRVRVKQSREFNDKAKRAGVDIEYIELDKGTHYFDEFQNRLAVFEALDKFLKEHL